MKLNATGKKSETDVTGDIRPEPGWYFAAVKFASETKVPDKVLVNFEVLGGTTPSQQGRCLEERFDTDGKHSSRLLRLAMSLYDPQKQRLVLAPGEQADVDFESCVGCLIVLEVERNEFDNREGKHVVTSRVAYGGMYAPSNPDMHGLMNCPEVLTAKQWLARNGYNAGDGERLAQFAQAQQPQQQPHPQQQQLMFPPQAMPQSVQQQPLAPQSPVNRFAGI